ncbi:MAG: TonB-dependent receptor [Candidatus Cyclobacteriaceae bacterium M2_1C_046]
MKKILWVALILVLPVFKVFSQLPQQQIRGQVYDEISRQPLSGAQVFLKNTDPLLGAVTDEDGSFIIEEVPVGRYVLTVKYIGYNTYSEDLLVKAGNDPIKNISLSPSLEELEAVVVTHQPFTVMPGTTNRKVTIEQATRFAANYLDPARIMTSFPGVVVQNDQNNNIIINGKSPNGILWRVEGMDIVNPNHLSNAGTLSDRPMQSGGGVNILSAQMLGETNLIMLPFSAQYGNAYSGIMDMQFREGNKYDHEFTVQAGLIGIDLAAEGPIQREKSSFLVNYRYSTVGLLTSMGVDFGGEEINFQDLSLKLNFDHKNGGNLSVFAFGGNSNNDFFGVADPDEWTFDKDSTQVFYGSEMLAAGFKDVRPISSSMSLSYGAILSSLGNTRTSYGLSRTGETELAEEFNADNQLISGNVELNIKLSSASHMQTGVMINYNNNSLFASEPYLNRGIIALGEEEGILYQPYIQYVIQLSPSFNAEAGARYMHYTFNDTKAFLPNLQLNYLLSSSTKLYVNYGWSAQKQDPTILLSDSRNEDLGMTKIQHAGIGVHKGFKNSLITAEIFYQDLSDIPVHAGFESSFSVFNELNELPSFPLANEGSAEVVGLNASVEQPFLNGYYYLLSGAVYESTYKGSDGIERDSRFNGNYSFTATAGKEILRKRTEDAVRTVNLDLRFMYAGGLRNTPVNQFLSELSGKTAYHENRAFSRQLDPYHRLDFRVAWRKEKQNYTRVLAIDIQNIYSRQNEAFTYFDFRQEGVTTKKQLGIIPILVYRVEF